MDQARNFSSFLEMIRIEKRIALYPGNPHLPEFPVKNRVSWTVRHGFASRTSSSTHP